MSKEASSRARRPQNPSNAPSSRSPSESPVVASGSSPVASGHDPDLLDKMSSVQYRAKRWTLGDSSNVVEGAAKEPAWVSLAWILVPAAFAVVVIFLMFRLGGTA